MSLTFRCYVYGAGRSWEAICVDLDIATAGASDGEARRRLAECIGMYLESLTEMPTDERRKLLERRAPWHVRARLSVMAWLSGLRGQTNRFSRFAVKPDIPATANGTVFGEGLTGV